MPETPDLKYYTPDGKVEPEYVDPDFWLSGRYKSFSTDTAQFFPIGEKFVQWLYNLDPNDTYGLGQEMVNITGIPKNPSDMDYLIRSHRPREIMRGMKGTIQWASNLDPSDSRYLSPEAREQLVNFAVQFPFLLDRLKQEAQIDFTWGGEPMLVEDLKSYGLLPGKEFKYWETYFPTIVDHMYQNIEKDDEGKVVSYEIRSVNPKLIELQKEKERLNL